ncbi:hypothetical protein [Erwinia endophytica]
MRSEASMCEVLGAASAEPLFSRLELKPALAITGLLALVALII